MSSVLEPVQALLDPTEGVARAVRARRWFWPLLILALAEAGSGVSFALRWSAAPAVIQKLQADGELAKVTEQELAGQVQTAERMALVGGVAKGVVWMPLATLFLGVALKVLGWLIGRPALFSNCFSAAAVGLLPVALFHLLFALAALKSSGLTQAEVGTLVPSSLLSLFRTPPSDRVARALGAVDFFNLWSAVLIGLGFSAAAKLSRLRGVLAGLTLYGAYALVFLIALPGLGGGR